MKDIIKLGIVLCLVSTLAAVGLASTFRMTEPIIKENKRRSTEEAYRKVLPEAVKFEMVSVPVTDSGILLRAHQLGLADKDEVQTGKATLTFTLGLKLGIKEKHEPAGVAFEVAPQGYSGPISTVVGLDMAGSVIGINVIQHTETPGLGSKMTEINIEKASALQKDNPRIEVRNPWFQEQFKGHSPYELFLKIDAVPENIEGLTDESSGAKSPSGPMDASTTATQSVQPAEPGVPRGTIDAITAATISSRAATNGIRKACVLWLNLKNEAFINFSKKTVVDSK
ncbi:MAG: FMN-binding protein [bacterium]|nr:FMN-binding protein [bacterium]